MLETIELVLLSKKNDITNDAINDTINDTIKIL